MDDLRLLVSPSPHIRDTDTTEKIMFAVHWLYCLL